MGKYYKKLYQQKLAEQIHKVQILKEYYEEIEAEKRVQKTMFQRKLAKSIKMIALTMGERITAKSVGRRHYFRRVVNLTTLQNELNF